MVKEGYLVQYPSDGDEVHTDLVDKETYDNVCACIENGDEDGSMEALFADDYKGCIQGFMMQTRCIDDWPYNGVNILGVACIAVY